MTATATATPANLFGLSKTQLRECIANAFINDVRKLVIEDHGPVEASKASVKGIKG
jgi:hypothetical protein